MDTLTNAIAEPVVQTPKNRYVNLDAYLANCETALINAADAEIAPLLAARNYPKTLIAEKQAELATLRQLIASQKKEYGEQYATTKAYTDAVVVLHPEYIDHLALARIALKNDTAAKTALALKGDRAQSTSNYCQQALLFYTGVLNTAAYKTALNKVGVTDEELNAAKAGYEALAEKAARKAKETGEAQAATANRDRAIDAFAQWFSDFKEIAMIALRKSPQLREKMGWKE